MVLADRRKTLERVDAETEEMEFKVDELDVEGSIKEGIDELDGSKKGRAGDLEGEEAERFREALSRVRE